MFTEKHKAFTLIELLVVIAIIGLLSSIVMVSLKGARDKAKNAKRLSDIKEYATVFELAYDQNGEYPDPGDTGWHCLGDYSDNRCWRNGTSYSESSTLNNILDDWIRLPADENLICGYANNPNYCYEGYIYRCVTRSGGICTKFDVRWFMKGHNQSCGIGKIIGNYNECTYCQYTNQ